MTEVLRLERDAAEWKKESGIADSLLYSPVMVIISSIVLWLMLGWIQVSMETEGALDASIEICIFILAAVCAITSVYVSMMRDEARKRMGDWEIDTINLKSLQMYKYGELIGIVTEINRKEGEKDLDIKYYQVQEKQVRHKKTSVHIVSDGEKIREMIMTALDTQYLNYYEQFAKS